jgi:hypothetical protein
MTNIQVKLFLSTLTMIAVCWMFTAIIRLDKEVQVHVTHFQNQENAIKFPVNEEGKVNVHGLEMDKQSLQRLIEMGVEQVKTNQFIREMVTGSLKVEVVKPTDITPHETIRTIIKEIETHGFMNDWIASQIYQIYENEKYLIHRMIRIYNDKGRDPDVRRRVMNFIEEMEND